ncbi:galectin-3b [Maylandia zebra]|uniref:Galectin n=3 Tax=Haplochromini TaxID=319058 RepID=A0A3Q2WFW1_HAPBU|nr:galectin-3b [Haplochromis burtoni]XP_026008351.1 galectin-3-like [Astatotilapia calliptera]
MDLSDALDGGTTQSAAGGGLWPGGGNNQAGGGLWPGQPNAPAWPGQPNQPTWPGGSTAPAWPGGQPANPTWPQGPSQPSGPWGPGPGPSPGPGPTPPVAPQQNLTVPFNMPLPQGVYDKLLITIAGTIKPNADKITVDLATARDIAFHFNPRFNEGGKKVIIRNSCIGEKWGKEERELQHFPFVPGQNFEIKILCTNTELKVAVNNSHMLDFKHRITNLRDIKRLNIYYDLTLSRVNLEMLP